MNLSLLQNALCPPHSFAMLYIVTPLFFTIPTGQGKQYRILGDRKVRGREMIAKLGMLGEESAAPGRS